MTYFTNNRNAPTEVIRVKKGFSLAEAMITLLLASIIMAAMAPLMTRKMRLSQTGFSSLTKSKKWALEYDNPDKNRLSRDKNGNQFLVDNTTTTVSVTMFGGGGAGSNAAITPQTAKQRTVAGAENWTVPTDVYSVKLTLSGAGGGGGGGGSKNPAPVNTVHTAVADQPYTIPAGTSEINVTLTGAGGGGGGGNGGGGGSGSDEYLVKSGADGGGDLCVKKYNVGTWSSEIAPAKSVYLRKAGVGSDWRNGTASDQRCWTTNSALGGAASAQTAGACDSTATSYSGCYRTVCTQPAATASCAAIGTGWRLPTTAEMQRWTSNNSSGGPFNPTYKGSTGIDLCDWNSGYGSALCHYVGSCSGSSSGWCYPSYHWTTSSGTMYYLYTGNYGQGNGYAASYAF